MDVILAQPGTALAIGQAAGMGGGKQSKQASKHSKAKKGGRQEGPCLVCLLYSVVGTECLSGSSVLRQEYYVLITYQKVAPSFHRRCIVSV